MGDPARKNANALEALRTKELILKRLLLADIRVDDKNRFAGRIVDQCPPALHKEFLARFANLTQLPSPFAIFHDRLAGFERTRRILKQERIGALANGFR